MVRRNVKLVKRQQVYQDGGYEYIFYRQIAAMINPILDPQNRTTESWRIPVDRLGEH